MAADLPLSPTQTCFENQVMYSDAPINELADQFAKSLISKKSFHEGVIKRALSRAMTTYSDPDEYAAQQKRSKGRIVPIGGYDPFLVRVQDPWEIVDLRPEDRRRARPKHLVGTFFWYPYYDVPKLSPYSHVTCPQEVRCIPFWQPPSNNYLSFIPYIKAEKEIMAKDDSRKELPWMTTAMDLVLELDLLDIMYEEAISDHIDMQRGTRGKPEFKELCPQTHAFYFDLHYELKEDAKTVREEIRQNDKLHCKKIDSTFDLKWQIREESDKHFPQKKDGKGK